MNQIVSYKYDFSNEEILAYYISFLKSLSFRLNPNTISFFYNEHQQDFPLYSEAIKFFNHKESMVRIAVRTITLNVFKVDDKLVQDFITNEQKAPYLPNLVWFIGLQSMELDECVNATDHLQTGRLSDLLAEHLDHLHYLHDMYELGIEELSCRLTVQLLDRMLIPLYVYSLAPPPPGIISQDELGPRISKVTALLLLSHVFAIFTHQPLVTALATELLKGNYSNAMSRKASLEPVPLLQSPLRKEQIHGNQKQNENTENGQIPGNSENTEDSHDERLATPPEKPVENGDANFTNEGGKTEAVGISPDENSGVDGVGVVVNESETGGAPPSPQQQPGLTPTPPTSSTPSTTTNPSPDSQTNTTSNAPTNKKSRLHKRFTAPEIILEQPMGTVPSSIPRTPQLSPIISGFNREGSAQSIDSVLTQSEYVFREGLYRAIECTDTDRQALPGLCLLYTLMRCQGVDDRLLRSVRLYPQRLLKPKLLVDALTSSIAANGADDNDDDVEVSKGKPMLSASVDGPMAIVMQSMTYSSQLAERCLDVIGAAEAGKAPCRLVTVEMASLVLQELCNYPGTEPCLRRRHQQKLDDLEGQTRDQLRHIYDRVAQQEFIDTFEEEYDKHTGLNVTSLMMDWSVLMAPTNTPLTGIPFVRRLPNGEQEKRRYCIHTFLCVRKLAQMMRRETEALLPLAPPLLCADRIDKAVDLNHADLISCKMYGGDKPLGAVRFLVVDPMELILVGPDRTRLGWGIIKVDHDLQNVETRSDRGEPRQVFVDLKTYRGRQTDVVTLRLVFDDHIRASAALKHLQSGTAAVKARKRARLEQLLGIVPLS